MNLNECLMYGGEKISDGNILFYFKPNLFTSTSEE